MASIMYHTDHTGLDALEVVRELISIRAKRLNEKRARRRKRKSFAPVHVTEVLVHPLTKHCSFTVSFSEMDVNARFFVAKAWTSYAQSMKQGNVCLS